MAKELDLPPFKHTPMESIVSSVQTIRKTFNSQKTKPLEYRLLQLRKLYWGIVDNEAAIVEACRRDLGKSKFETYLTEIDWCKNDIVFMTKHLPKWVKDESAPDIAWANKLVSPKIRKDPLGAILVIGAYNYPVQLALGPFIGAIAAGNTGVLKPSESAPNVAMVLAKVISVLDPSAFVCLQGAVPETTLLLDQKWDKIFYTGNPKVGQIIAKKAAETLTPVTLELGGLNPAIVTKNADVRLAARRLLWAKFHNAGQVCVSQNYTIIDREVLQGFVRELRSAIQEFYPQGAKDSPDYGRLVNQRNFARIKKMLDSSNGKILIGGAMDESDLFIEPTVVEVNDTSDSLVVEESFGPVLPIFPVDNLDQAIRIANEVHDTPLGVYPFGNKQETARVLQEVRSGGASVNDAFFHCSIPTLAFGGVGQSGQGSYRGRASFDCFTHRRSVTTTPGWMESLLKVRYPPYVGKLEQFQRMNSAKPDFDRDGKVKLGLLGWVFTLGSGSASGGAARYAFILLAAIGLKQYLDRRAKL